MARIFALVFLSCFLLSACDKSPIPENTTLVLNIEERIFNEDTIYNYQVFNNGVVSETLTHSSTHPDQVFAVKYKKLSAETITDLISKIESLRELDYHNDFPWKEDFTKRATVYKFEFLKEVQTEALDDKDPQNILVPVVYYYYSGLQEEPKVFQEIVELL